MPTVKLISIAQLELDVTNPRHDPQSDQHAEYRKMLEGNQFAKIYKLAEDICKNGTNPADLPIVIWNEESQLYTVLEGNRRVVALKLLSSPELIDGVIERDVDRRKFKSLARNEVDRILSGINCTVVESRDEAYHWINLKHTGENEGVGVVAWDGTASARFRGNTSVFDLATQVKEAGLLSEEVVGLLPRMPITNVERVLNTPEARRKLGLDKDKSGAYVVLPNHDSQQALRRLAILFADIITRKITVADLDRKEQRIKYAAEVVERSNTAVSAGAIGSPDGSPSQASEDLRKQKSSSESKPLASPRSTVNKHSKERKTLIPKDCRINIPQKRINNIFLELRSMPISEYTNSCAVMVRVFLELSLDEFIAKQRSGLPSNINVDSTFAQKLKAAKARLVEIGLVDKHQERIIDSVIDSRSPQSVIALNLVVHNKDYHPSSDELITFWDNLQNFIVVLWDTISKP